MERNPYFDNIRVMLIFFVVLGHMIQPFTSDSDGMRTLYVWIYTFHMPAFILISGYFAKGRSDKKYIWNLFKKLLLPYVVFQMIYTGYYYLLGREDWYTDLFYPQWALWFLISLFSWHILLILFKRLRPVYAISLALFIGAIIGYINGIGHMFSLSRTFVFFPFFLLGFYLTEKHLMFLKTKAAMITGMAFMVGVAGAIYYLPNIDTDWLLASKSFSELDAATGGGLIRLLLYIGSLAMIMSVFAWVPTKQITSVTHIGTKTLYIYLLHGFFIQYFREIDLFQARHIYDVLGLVFISVLLIYLLSSKLVVRITQPLVEGKVSWLQEKRQKRKT